MAGTNYHGGVYQIASKLENDDNGNVISSGTYVMGTYLPRTTTGAATVATFSGTDFVFTGVLNGNTAPAYSGSVNLKPSGLQGFYAVSDVIDIVSGGTTATCIVSSVSQDQSIIIFKGCNNAF